VICETGSFCQAGEHAEAIAVKGIWHIYIRTYVYKYNRRLYVFVCVCVCVCVCVFVCTRSLARSLSRMARLLLSSVGPKGWSWHGNSHIAGKDSEKSMSWYMHYRRALERVRLTICAAETKVEKTVCVFLRLPWVFFQVETRAQLATRVELLAADSQTSAPW
jgi:hypothetical protein